MNKKLVLIKVHKTAATVVRDVIENYAKDNGLSIWLPTMYIQTNFVENLDKAYLKGINFDVSARHIAYNKEFFDSKFKDAIFITSVREPLERSISHYYYLHPSNHNSNFDNFNVWYMKNKDKPTPKIPAHQQIHIGYNNFMSKWMGFEAIEDITEENLNDRFDLITIREKMDESLSKLGKLLDIKKPENKIIRKTDRTDYLNFKVSDEVKEIFKERNKLDYKLYNMSLEIFKKYNF